MLTLERLRLVNWHNFDNALIEIGNRCLLAGDNGSGKSTVIDAIQYVLAANLRMARFNSAAEERKGGGRDLIGYVRCKLGSDATDYRRGDTVAHVMLEWSGPAQGEGFSCGVCIEAWKDNHYTEHFWVGSNIPIETIEVKNENGAPLLFRQFKNSAAGKNIDVYEAKRLYIRDITNRLGVFSRRQEVNPYLDSLTRSIGFKPLSSIDQFVCDYILEENPVDIQAMKQNLENYKEADRQAKAAIAKIGVLKKICAKAAEWRNYDGLILKQEYLKIRIEQENEKQKKEAAVRRLNGIQNQIEETSRKIALLAQKRLDMEQELRAVDISLAANDAHRLFEEISGRIKRKEQTLAEEEKKAGNYAQLKAQCEALLDRKLSENFDEEGDALSSDLKECQEAKYKARQQKEEAGKKLKDLRSELADLERGILRYPDAPRQLKTELEKSGIEAFFLAEVAEITDSDWVDAVEGWLNTRRFVLLVNPAVFQKALEIYNSLPRGVAGAFIPNIEKMRSAHAQPGSLAEIVKAEGYARIYIDYTLGKVVRADIASLKQYEQAVTKECMTYTNHTASRIKEEVYRRHYLGRQALEERRLFLAAEIQKTEAEFSSFEKLEREAENREDCLDRVMRHLPKLELLFPAIEACAVLANEIEEAKKELAGIDTRSFRELEKKRNEFREQLTLLNGDNDRLQNQNGAFQNELSVWRRNLDTSTLNLEAKESAIADFGREHPLMISECESYAEEKLAANSIAGLTDTYESTLKHFKTRTESLKKEYAKLIAAYEIEFHYFLNQDPAENNEAENLLKRLESSELPEYREKIARAYHDAEREFREHFIARLNERIEEARDSFKEINEILRTLNFGRDQYWFHLEELSDRKGQIEVIRHAAKIPAMDDGLFNQIEDPAERKAAEELFNRILNSPLDSKDLRDICDYRTYFHYDIKIKETGNIDSDGNPAVLSLSKVLKEKSGGESQTPYYVAIAASFYRFYRARPESTVRLVIFDEAFNRMDDERIGKILVFYRDLNLQIITSVPPEKIEAIGPFMDRINIISRFGSAVKIRDCHKDLNDIEAPVGG